MTRRQTEAGQGDNQRIDKQILAVGEQDFTTDETEDIATAQFRRPKGVDTASMTLYCITPRHSLIPARTKQALQGDRVAQQSSSELLSLNRQHARYRIFYL